MSSWRVPLPLVALAGAVLFGLGTLVHRNKVEPGRGPGTAETVAAAARVVTISTAEIDTLRASFRSGWRREPTDAELADLAVAAIDEEVLYREGVARGLDRDDPVVRRRMIEKMTAVARPKAPTSDPPRDELRRWYQMYSHRFVHPATATFDQLFFDSRHHADAGAAAREALATLAATRPTDAPPAAIGDAFPLPPRLTDKSQMELAHLYGDEFARQVMAAPIGRWQGPLVSRHGTHLIRVGDRRAQRLPPFEEAERYVRADWLTVEMRGQRAAAESLLPRYEVALPADLRRQLASMPAATALMKRVR